MEVPLSKEHLRRKRMGPLNSCLLRVTITGSFLIKSGGLDRGLLLLSPKFTLWFLLWNPNNTVNHLPESSVCWSSGQIQPNMLNSWFPPRPTPKSLALPILVAGIPSVLRIRLKPKTLFLIPFCSHIPYPIHHQADMVPPLKLALNPSHISVSAAPLGQAIESLLSRLWKPSNWSLLVRNGLVLVSVPRPEVFRKG